MDITVRVRRHPDEDALYIQLHLNQKGYKCADAYMFYDNRLSI